MVLGYWQRGGAPQEVRTALTVKPGEQGIEAARLRAVARSRGLQAFLVEGAVDDLSHEVEKRRPVIVGLVRVVGSAAVAHYVVVAGINRRSGRLLTADPQQGWREVSLGDFLAEWERAHRLTLVVFPEEPGTATPPRTGALPLDERGS
jgi:hypothetical protein